jgi:hypothetical protein
MKSNLVSVLTRIDNFLGVKRVDDNFVQFTSAGAFQKSISWEQASFLVFNEEKSEDDPLLSKEFRLYFNSDGEPAAVQYNSLEYNVKSYTGLWEGVLDEMKHNSNISAQFKGSLFGDYVTFNVVFPGSEKFDHEFKRGSVDGPTKIRKNLSFSIDWKGHD